MSRLAIDVDGAAIQAIYPGTVQVIGVSGASGQSAAFNAATDVVRLWSDQNCFVVFGSNPTASSSTGTPLTAGVAEYFSVPASSKLAVIQSTTVGSIWITEGGNFSRPRPVNG